MQDERNQQWFLREARVMARVNHPGAVTVHDFGVIDGEPFIEMEYIEGDPLHRVLKPDQPMPLEWIERVMNQLCDVLDTAHRERVVHRDIKPSNLMLVEGGPPGRDLKVLDFGIAKLLEPGGELTLAGQGLGSPGYASPEQAEGRTIDHRADVYSLGVLLYKFLTGRMPLKQAEVSLPPRDWAWPPGPSTPGTPPALRQLVRECLAYDPGRRPQTVREIRSRLAAALGTPPEARRPPARTRFTVAGGGLLAGAAVLGGVLVWSRRGENLHVKEAETSRPAAGGRADSAVAKKRAGPPAPVEVGPRKAETVGVPAVLGTILEDVLAIDVAERFAYRYVSWNHLLAAGMPAASVEAALVRLEARLSEIRGGSLKLSSTRGHTGVFRLDLRQLGWDQKPYKRIMAGDTPPIPSELSLYDLLLLEYSYGWIEARSIERKQLDSEYLEPLKQIRPIAYLRGDWLEAALNDPDLVADLAGKRDVPDGSSDVEERWRTLGARDASAELGFGDPGGLERALKRAPAGGVKGRLEELCRGSKISRNDWVRLFPLAVKQLDLGIPIAPIDTLKEIDVEAATDPVSINLDVKPKVYRLGGVEPLSVTFYNPTKLPAHCEWYAFSGGDGVQVDRHPGDMGVKNLGPQSFILSAEYPTDGPRSRDLIVAFTSRSPFTDGVRVVSPGRRERFVHMSGLTDGISRKVLAIAPEAD